MQQPSLSPITYYLYARKSTESEDRQVQSLEDQLTHLRELAAVRGLHVAAEFVEARSARSPGQRPIFEDVLGRIESGTADGLLCWQLNRLSRNPVDSGRLSWLLQSGRLKSILTIERDHRPDDNVLLFAVETGMANQYVLDLSRNVRRGIQGKLQRGDLPGLAPVGYLNDPATRTVVPDPQRFESIAMAWQWLLRGTHSVSQILAKLNDDGFRSAPHPHSGGRSLALSGLYRLLSNPFYAGLIRHSGRTFVGRHKPMITLAQFQAAQALLHSPTRPRPQKHHLVYSRLFTCGSCGAAIVGESKAKRIKSDGSVRQYVYYRCNSKVGSGVCADRRYVTERDLTESIATQLRSFSISASFHSFALEHLRRSDAATDQMLADRRKRLTVDRDALRRQQSILTQMRLRELLTDEEFNEQRLKLIGDISLLDCKIAEQARTELFTNQVGAHLSELVDLEPRFIVASPEERRAILLLVGWNRQLQGPNVRIQPKSWLQPIASSSQGYPAKNERIEPMRSPVNTTQKGAFAPSLLTWQCLVDEVRNRFAEMPEEKRQAASRKAA